MSISVYIISRSFISKSSSIILSATGVQSVGSYLSILPTIKQFSFYFNFYERSNANKEFKGYR